MSDKTTTLVALDLDGTLLTDKKEISQATCDYLLHLQNMGVIICLASGRPYRAMKKYYQQIGLNSKVICGNGAMIIDPTDNDKILFKTSYPTSAILKCISAVGYEAFDLIMVEDGKDVYLSREKKPSEEFIWTNNMNVIIGNHFNQAKNPDGAIFILKTEKDKNALISASNAPDSKIGVRFWGTSLVAELYFKSINKASGLRKLEEIYNISSSSVIAFGDDDNDVEMLIQSDIGVGMKNGSELASKNCSMLSLDDNNHDGVMKTLQLLLHGI